MRSVFLFMMVSVDGYFEGPNHDINWHNVDDEFNTFAVNQLDEADTLVFGRRTYELMAGYWPTQQARQDDASVAKRMNGYAKLVFSRTLTSAGWGNTRLYHDNPGEVLAGLKAAAGKSIAVLGSSNLCLSLLEAGVLDEVRLMVAPLALGRGTSLFAGLNHPLHLQLTATRKFQNGNELLTYRVKK